MTETILIVEDDPQISLWLDYELAEEGYHTTVANSGDQGLANALTGVKPDLILLDVQLPGLTGFEVCHQLQQKPDTAMIPIIFLTARATLDDKLNGLKNGAVDYLTKPFKMDELKARVETNLRRNQVVQEQAQASLDNYKRNITGIVRHEMRTPIAITQSALELLDTPHIQADETHFREVLGHAQKGLYRMSQVSEDLLFVKTLDEKGIRPLLAMTTRPLQECFIGVMPQLEKKYLFKALQFEINVPKDIEITIMRNHINLMLTHLLDNACKFSGAEQCIEIQATEMPDGGFILKVRDYGPGIIPEEVDQIFERFYQSDMSMCRPHDGLGLGLYIVKQLALAYNGNLTVESTPGQGSEFILTIPRTD
ncbi:MAG: hybrid sensor histidine kinase/response regulator [Chloroflexota bacterium]